LIAEQRLKQLCNNLKDSAIEKKSAGSNDETKAILYLWQTYSNIIILYRTRRFVSAIDGLGFGT